jgi:hypothetical protein
LWFPVGEELVYRLTWGFIPIGTSVIRSEWVEREGRELIRVHYRTYTNRIFDRIYPMNDAAEVFIEPRRFRPTVFSFSRTRRGPARKDRVVFDYAGGTAEFESHGSETNQTVRIPQDMRDIISFLYHMRRHKFRPGEEVGYKVVGNTGIVDLKLKTVRKETINLPVFGRVECLRLEPEADLKDMLVEKGRITMWVTLDERMIAPRLAMQAPLADVRITLCSVHGPGSDRWVRMTKEAGDDHKCSTPDMLAPESE